MSNSIPNIANIAADFMGQFHGRHMILFAGKSTLDKDLEGVVSTLPWSCIITSRSDGAFSNSFIVNDRQVKDFYRPEEVPSRPLNKVGILPILHICGDTQTIDDDIREELSLIGQTVEEYQNDKMNEMLRLLPGLFDGSNILIFIGYDPSVLGEIPYKLIAKFLSNQSLHDGSVHFWGINSSDEQIQLLQKLADKKGFLWHEENLGSVIEFWQSDSSSAVDESTKPSEGDELFYKGGQSVGISPQVLLQFRHFATLLSEQTVFAVRPYGRVQQARWYYNFLTLSSTEGPQWYGYLRNSEFYLRRDYEDALVSLVRKQLSGNDPAESGPQSPIILFGDPGSSKSITLGALAYRVYSKHVNPVIFLKNDTLLFTNDSSETEELRKLMETIDRIEGPDTRILLIWDCSSYQNISKNAKRLSKILTDRGRRFVLVCSAYDDLDTLNEKRKYYSLERNETGTAFKPGDEQNHDVFYCNECYYINATRKLSEKERLKLWQNFITFSGIQRETAKRIKEKVENEEDIFNYFYTIISLLRPNLEQALTREEKMVTKYVSEQIEKIDKRNPQGKESMSTIAKAFLDADIDLSSLGIDLSSIELNANQSEISSNYDLHRFNTCIALFSRFKIEVSYSLAIQMLKAKDANLQEINQIINKDLFSLITTRIPWLRYGESKSENDYAFSFRNALEAELFLSRNNISGEKQVDLLCDILELFGRFYSTNHFLLDPTLAQNLQRLVRLMGPNSTYPPFKNENVKTYKEILLNLEKIISVLEKLCIIDQIPDYDVGFAFILITFTREFYGNKWIALYSAENGEYYTPEKYLYRINKLHSILLFTTKKIEELEYAIRDSRQYAEIVHLSNQRNGLIVELAHCNVLIQQLKRYYLEVCSSAGVEAQPLGSFSGLNYKDVYDQLYDVILNNPGDGHAYNALFKAFEEMYEHSPLSDIQKLKYLSEIKLIADDCESIDIQKRGSEERDEIREHLVKIAQYSSNYCVTIDDIHAGTVDPAFNKLYQNMLEANASTAVTFVCQQELEKAKINYATDSLSDYQLMTCKKVMNFMQEEQNASCINSNYYALNLLLRVTWMSYTERQMKDEPECQLIRLPYEKWDSIKRISQACIDAARSQTVNRAKPLIVLINALATLEVTWDYAQCDSIVHSLSVDQFYFSSRMKVPFIVCNENGPLTYSGVVTEVNGYNGYIKVDDFPILAGGRSSVRFRNNNLGLGSRMPEEKQRLRDFELGLGYTGFSAYSKAGREYRGKQK